MGDLYVAVGVADAMEIASRLAMGFLTTEQALDQLENLPRIAPVVTDDYRRRTN